MPKDKLPSDRPVRDRSNYPGVSTKYDPLSAYTIYKEILHTEQRHLAKKRDGSEGSRRFWYTDPSTGESVCFKKFNSYADLDPKQGHTVWASFPDPPSAEPAPKQASLQSKEQSNKAEYEEKYRFFSPNPQSIYTDSQRLRDFSDFRQAGRDDPILLSDEEVRRQEDARPPLSRLLVDEDFRRTIDSCVKSLNSAKEAGSGGSQFSGYVPQKYKYFSGGAHYPYSGSLDRFITAQPQYLTPPQPSLLRGSQPPPRARPSKLS